MLLRKSKIFYGLVALVPSIWVHRSAASFFGHDGQTRELFPSLKSVGSFFGKILFLGFIFDLITWIAGHGLCASAPAWAPSMRRGMPADRRTCTSTSIHDPSEHWLLRIPLFELLPSLLRVTLLSLVLVACGMRFSRVLLSWRRATAAKLK
mmetsp:Transcript_25394/g.59050  ORF Transcript_25394/g.59050 Transcript_25394/m.59050 type:complete len:151 (-) Transcript_25394:272-724(-)